MCDSLENRRKVHQRTYRSSHDRLSQTPITPCTHPATIVAAVTAAAVADLMHAMPLPGYLSRIIGDDDSRCVCYTGDCNVEAQYVTMPSSTGVLLCHRSACMNKKAAPSQGEPRDAAVKFRYVSIFTTASCGFPATVRLSTT